MVPNLARLLKPVPLVAEKASTLKSARVSENEGSAKERVNTKESTQNALTVTEKFNSNPYLSNPYVQYQDSRPDEAED